MRAEALRIVADEIERVEESRKKALNELKAARGLSDFVSEFQQPGRPPEWVSAGLAAQVGDQVLQNLGVWAVPSVTIAIRFMSKSGLPDSVAVTVPID